MEHSYYKNTKTVYLSCVEPTTVSYEISSFTSLQGSTTVLFNLTGIQTSNNLLNIKFVRGDEVLFTVGPRITPSGFTIPSDIEAYTIYSTSSGLDTKIIRSNVLYRTGLSASIVNVFTVTPESLLDMDINVLNTQASYTSGVVIPMINLETKDSVIYPIGLSPESLLADDLLRSYLMTDPELSASQVLSAVFSDLSASGYINTESRYRIRAV